MALATTHHHYVFVAGGASAIRLLAGRDYWRLLTALWFPYTLPQASPLLLQEREEHYICYAD